MHRVLIYQAGVSDVMRLFSEKGYTAMACNFYFYTGLVSSPILRQREASNLVGSLDKHRAIIPGLLREADRLSTR